MLCYAMLGWSALSPHSSPVITSDASYHYRLTSLAGPLRRSLNARGENPSPQNGNRSRQSSCPLVMAWLYCDRSIIRVEMEMEVVQSRGAGKGRQPGPTVRPSDPPSQQADGTVACRHHCLYQPTISKFIATCGLHGPGHKNHTHSTGRSSIF